jgi:hypothetical protein
MGKSLDNPAAAPLIRRRLIKMGRELAVRRPFPALQPLARPASVTPLKQPDRA